MSNNIKIIYNVDEILNLVKYKILKHNILIGIDGFTSVGKSRLAEKIFEKFGIKHIKIDENAYIKKSFNCFTEAIKYKHLEKDINYYFKNGNPVIVDSICLLHILKIINRKCDLFIYVKDYSWLCEEWLDCNQNNKFSKLNINNTHNKIKPTPIDKEIIDYHKKYKLDKFYREDFYRKYDDNVIMFDNDSLEEIIIFDKDRF